jgi:hypothetical protein
MRVWRMDKRITVDISDTDHQRLVAIVTDRNSPQKHVWRAQIVLLTADGCGTMELARRTGTSKTLVWRWQERFVAEGIPGLLRDKTRPARIPPLGTEVEAASSRPRKPRHPVKPPTGPRWQWPATSASASVPCSESGASMVSRRIRSASSSSQRSAVCRQAARYCWALPQSAGAWRRPVDRREEPDPGARSHPAGLADEKGTLRHHDPRLQAPWHHHPVCCA